MSLILTNLKHFAITASLLLIALICFGIFIGADAHLFEDRRAYDLDGETQVFFKDGHLVRSIIRGDNDTGFVVQRDTFSSVDEMQVSIRFPADDSVFTVSPSVEIRIPEAIYQTDAPIIALSDIESGFGAFKQFLIAHGVTDEHLNWRFGQGHLVLVGDFVDRGASTSQVLWAIYSLEQSARQHGGAVHYIIGNHEIKNLQGNFQSAEDKYFYIAGMMGKQQFELYDDNSLLGRWLASKNVLEVINGVAFVHGGLHPRLAEQSVSIEQINAIVRGGYRQLYFTPQEESLESFLRSSTTGPAWYRGYFKDDLSQDQIDRTLAALGIEAVVVGHTLQSSVNALYDNKVFAIDVKHRKDYLTSFPLRKSEGLLINKGKFFRLQQDGDREAL